jgi:hypothetical protein
MLSMDRTIARILDTITTDGNSMEEYKSHEKYPLYVDHMVKLRLMEVNNPEITEMLLNTYHEVEIGSSYEKKL